MAKVTEGPIEAAIVGAGPYGLSVAAHLRAAGVGAMVFGTPMAFWRDHMPAGMLLRSVWEASHIADPTGELTLDEYEAARGERIPKPIPLADFIDYGDWYRQRLALDVDSRHVSHVARHDGLFRATLDDGAVLDAHSLIVATGIEYFASRPPNFARLSRHRVSHSSEHASFSGFNGKRVAVVGGGQSAAESAALLSEAGAEVELVLRKPQLYWLAGDRLTNRPRLRRLLYPPTDVGPPGLNWIVAVPALFRALPPALQYAVAKRVLRPAAADWLRPRLENVVLRMGRTIVSSEDNDNALALTFDDGSRGQFDHLLLATGYRVDISRLPFLTDLIGSLRLVRGSPHLGPGFESSISRLHFVGAAATASFGPIMRFVTGTGYASRGVTARLRRA